MKHFKSRLRTSHHQQGFSLVEVMVAAVVMISLMLGTNRMIALGMASSSDSSSRYVTEQEILGDIEDIQNIDTRLSNDPDCVSSQSSSKKLLDAVTNELGDASSTARADEGNSSEQEIARWNRDLNAKDQYSDNPDILVITYTFWPNGPDKESELRVIEITPSFQTACPLIS